MFAHTNGYKKIVSIDVSLIRHFIQTYQQIIRKYVKLTEITGNILSFLSMPYHWYVNGSMIILFIRFFFSHTEECVICAIHLFYSHQKFSAFYVSCDIEIEERIELHFHSKSRKSIENVRIKKNQCQFDLLVANKP